MTDSIRRLMTVGGVTCLLFLSTYCKDDWTKKECEEWDDQQVNGVSWHFHSGQPCDERGTPATL